MGKTPGEKEETEVRIAQIKNTHDPFSILDLSRTENIAFASVSWQTHGCAWPWGFVYYSVQQPVHHQPAKKTAGPAYSGTHIAAPLQ